MLGEKNQVQSFKQNLSSGEGATRSFLIWKYVKLNALILKTLFNIVEERLKKLLNFDVSAV